MILDKEWHTHTQTHTHTFKHHSHRIEVQKLLKAIKLGIKMTCTLSMCNLIKNKLQTQPLEVEPKTDKTANILN